MFLNLLAKELISLQNPWFSFKEKSNTSACLGIQVVNVRMKQLLKMQVLGSLQGGISLNRSRRLESVWESASRFVTSHICIVQGDESPRIAGLLRAHISHDPYQALSFILPPLSRTALIIMSVNYTGSTRHYFSTKDKHTSSQRLASYLYIKKRNHSIFLQSQSKLKKIRKKYF